jgi:hypothetical protein
LDGKNDIISHTKSDAPPGSSINARAGDAINAERPVIVPINDGHVEGMGQPWVLQYTEIFC